MKLHIAGEFYIVVLFSFFSRPTDTLSIKKGCHVTVTHLTSMDGTGLKLPQRRPAKPASFYLEGGREGEGEGGGRKRHHYGVSYY